MKMFALAAVAALAMTTNAFAGTCAMSKAGGIGVSQEIASFMSNKALHNMLVAHGEKGYGKVTTKCEPGLVVNCVSAQRSCK